MASSIVYSISSAGGVVDGHEPDTVISEFCTIFGVQKDKAAAYLETQKLIKKDLSEVQAFAYRDKFTEIGIPVTLKKHEVEMPDEFSGLSLTPANEPQADAPNTTANVTAPAVSGSQFSCPKCSKEQNPSDTCTSCGIIFEKYQAKQVSHERNGNSAGSAPAARAVDREAVHHNLDDDDAFSVPAVGVGAIVAILGAFVWYMIATIINSELALVAWGIGGAIGAASAMLGSRSYAQGVVCGVLLVLAIAGGKYMAAGAIAEQVNAAVVAIGEETDYLVEAFAGDAAEYVSMSHDELSVKTYMSERTFSEGYEASEVTAEEYDHFQRFIAPFLTALHRDPDSVDNALIQGFMFGDDAASGYTQSEVFSELWGMWDLLFLLLGTVTAFKLGSGRGGM